MTSFIDKQFEANLKANTELIAVCSTLTDEQLTVEVEGILAESNPSSLTSCKVKATPYATCQAQTPGRLIPIGTI